MVVLFCNSPENKKNADPAFIKEYSASIELNITTFLFSFEDLVINKKTDKALSSIPVLDKEKTAIYRGWMLKPSDYVELYNSLIKKNIKLINSPTEYIHCHYLPENYKIIKNITPKSMWIEIYNPALHYPEIMDKLKIFKGKPIIVKDYVKSCKHCWYDACFIKKSSDINEVKRVTGNFMDFQGDDLNKGLVFREYVELEYIKDHPKSKMPLSLEYRLFFINHKLIDVYNYWEEVEYFKNDLSISGFKNIAKKIQSNFFTMDIAKTEQGKWIIIELGDGQVAGLPEGLNIKDFYKRLGNF